MIINDSAVLMQSQRSYSQVSSTQKTTVSAGSNNSRSNIAASLFLSGETQTEKKIDLGVRLKELEKERKEQMKEQMQQQLKDQMDSSKGVSQMTDALEGGGDEQSIQFQALKRMLEELQRMMRGETPRIQPMKIQSLKMPNLLASGGKKLELSQGNINQIPRANVWTKQTVVSSFYAEMENTAFSTVGTVKTADGREINFNVEIEMTRSFMEANSYLKEETVILTDPLVINLDTKVATVSDQKFLFDLDGDGTEDEISFLDKGSGFLALDKNGDGKINDGNELFGTQSGNGFKDLAEFDEDGNGWIDERDSVFSQLKIWFKDENGEDKLLDLYEAGVGAFYLDNVSTEFSLKNQETNKTNGVIQSTGVYLKENGEVGTMQHVDLAL